MHKRVVTLLYNTFKAMGIELASMSQIYILRAHAHTHATHAHA